MDQGLTQPRLSATPATNPPTRKRLVVEGVSRDQTNILAWVSGGNLSLVDRAYADQYVHQGKQVDRADPGQDHFAEGQAGEGMN